MGRQGSGKTTRVCQELKRRSELRLRWQRYLPASFQLEIRDNFFNHLALDDAGRMTFISGMADHRKAYLVDKFTKSGRIVLEFPHSGYLPPNCNGLLNHATLETRIFVLVLPEETWRSYDRDVGVITSPTFFMTHGSRRTMRAAVNYADDCEQIKTAVRASGVPFEIYSSTDEMIEPILQFLGL